VPVIKDTLKMAASDSEIIGAAIFKFFVGSLSIPEALVAASLFIAIKTSLGSVVLKVLTVLVSSMNLSC
jgi:hypothetical protein